MGDTDAAEWSAPGPGCWTLDRSHYPGGTTPITEWIISSAMPAGMERVFDETGAPIRAVDAQFVNGFMYNRRRPLVRPDQPATSLPPEPVLKLVSHLHPELRRRARTARRVLEERPSLAVAADWDARRRPQLVDLNLSLQALDLDALDDDALDAHVGALLDHNRVAAELHFWLHGHDLGPIAQLLARCDDWGVDAERAVEMLAGASPSTSLPAERLVRLRAIVDDAGAAPTTVDDVRAISTEAAALVDEYLAHHGRVLATGYDLTATTLIEMPALFLQSIRTAEPPPADTHAEIAAELRQQVPDDQRDEFDDLLDGARSVMDMRDDNGPLTVEWPMGLLRLALLTVGRRLVTRGAWEEPELALEVTPDEGRRLLATGGTPGESTLRERRDRRQAFARLTPPIQLGDPEPEPSPDVLPAPLPDFVRTIQAAFRHLGMDGTPDDDAPAADGLAGVGVGDRTHVGVARVVSTADEAIDALAPDEVLVVRATSPAFNVVLAVAGSVVTADGGVMSHAAVLARELGIPAVVGARDALSIPDGATVEVDAAAGRVTVLDR